MGKFQYLKNNSESLFFGKDILKKQLIGLIHLKKISGIKGNMLIFVNVKE